MIPSSAPEGATGSPPDESRPGAQRAHDTHKSITMADIAKAAGVSQGAISSLLNDRDYGIRVSEKTRDRVFRVCREMGYIPNDLRAVVRMYPELGNFCVLLSSELEDLPSDPFQIRVISSAMGAIGDQVIIARYKADVDYATDAEALPQTVRAGTTSKYLLLGKPNASLCQALVARGYGVALASHDVALAGVTSILPDFAGASQTAIDYLFGLGHKRVAILSGPFGATDYHIIEFNHGVRASFDKAGIPVEAQNIIYGDLTMDNGYKAVDLLIDRPTPPTAVFCFGDAAAAGVIARAQARGLKVPEDLSVIGTSDDALSAHIQPALTTVHLPAEAIGVTAVEETDRRVREREAFPTEARKVLLPVKLVKRASSGPPSKARK
ncbi:MAG: LacI family DNA-binding transcriptional regulator [Chthoniobacteraceae bacterium]|jgi:DNA-binding LacI/PurR family transcriptional regulator